MRRDLWRISEISPRLLGFEPGFGAFGGFLVDESSRFIALGFGLGHLLSYSTPSLGRSTVLTCANALSRRGGQRQVRLRD